VAGGAFTWRWAHRPTGFAAAVALAPAGTARVTWTDWSGIREALHADVGSRSSQARVRAFLDRGYDRDLTSTSALESSVGWLRQVGVSPATLDWELLAQSDQGAALLLHVPDSLDLGALADRLSSAGFRRPADADGVWRGGGDVATALGLTPELQDWVLLPDQRLVVTSDTAEYAALAAAAVTGGGDRVTGLEDVASAVGQPLSAVVFTGAYVCEKLAMASADAGARDEADRLVAAAGGVSPLDAYAMAAEPGGSVRVAFGFDSEERAAADLRPRARLAAGPAPGQGGDFGDRFVVRRARADGRVVTLDLRPREGAAVLSDLSSGPVLFASC
jgi:hypothetical protein